MSNSERYPMHEESSSGNSRITCGAKTRTGIACKNSPVIGKKRCRMHGGASLSGMDHWNFQHGFWSIEERRQRSQMMRIMKEYLDNTSML